MSDIDRLRLAADRLEQPYWQRPDTILGDGRA